MSELKLKFSGLCGLVPKKPIDQPNNQMRVLLVNARHAGHGTHSVYHTPVLVCENRLVKTGLGLRSPDRKYWDPRTRLSMALFSLDDQDVSIIGAPPNSLTFKGPAAVATCPTSTTMAESFAWTGPMKGVSPGSEIVKAECLAPDNVDASVAGRVAVTAGEVKTSVSAADNDKTILQWEFRQNPEEPPVPLVQALAEEVQLSYTFDTPTIELQTQKFGPPAQPTQIVRLTPIVGTAVAWILNMPWEDILSRRMYSQTDHRDPDYHFAHFYDLSESPGDKNIPYPCLDKPRCDHAPGPGLNNPQCPPVRYADNGDA